MNRKDQRQLETVRRGQVDTAKHLAKSQEAIEESLSVLQHSDDRMEVVRKHEAGREPFEGHGQHRAAQEKRRPRRSVRRPATP
jgi:hypothetical protein